VRGRLAVSGLAGAGRGRARAHRPGLAGPRAAGARGAGPRGGWVALDRLAGAVAPRAGVASPACAGGDAAPRARAPARLDRRGAVRAWTSSTGTPLSAIRAANTVAARCHDRLRKVSQSLREEGRHGVRHQGPLGHPTFENAVDDRLAECLGVRRQRRARSRHRGVERTQGVGPGRVGILASLARRRPRCARAPRGAPSPSGDRPRCAPRTSARRSRRVAVWARRPASAARAWAFAVALSRSCMTRSSGPNRNRWTMNVSASTSRMTHRTDRSGITRGLRWNRPI
jgi:hypothetical protein